MYSAASLSYKSGTMTLESKTTYLTLKSLVSLVVLLTCFGGAGRSHCVCDSLGSEEKLSSID